MCVRGLAQDGDCIIRQGDAGNEFFVLVAGEASVVHRAEPGNPRDKPKEIMRLKPNQARLAPLHFLDMPRFWLKRCFNK